MSRLARNKMEGSGYVSDLLKTLAPLALSPIASSVGERVGRWISPKKSGSGYKTMGMGYKTMGMGYKKRKSSSRRKSGGRYKRKSSSRRKSGGRYRRKSVSKTKRGGSTRINKKKVSRRRSAHRRIY